MLFSPLKKKKKGENISRKNLKDIIKKMCCLAITIITAIIIYLSACLILLDFVNRVICVQLIVFNITKTRFTYEHCTVTHSICSTLFQSLFFSFVRGQRRDERGRG